MNTVLLEETMVKKIIFAMGMICLFLSGSATAAQWVIKDNYIGGGMGSYQNNNGDVIAYYRHVDRFDITGMTVEIDDALNIKVKINTAFSPDTAGYGIDYGDLFISTNGWSAPGRNDIYDPLNTDWEYVFDTSGLNIFSFSTSGARTSNDFGAAHTPNPWAINEYRRNQLVQFDPTGYNPTDEKIPGTNRFDKSDPGMLIYAFNLSDLGLSADEEIELGFRWTMTCANDVIEGGVSLAAVPEPTTFILLGIGLVGIVGLGKKNIIGKSTHN